MPKTLHGQRHPLSIVAEQRGLLRPGGSLQPFEVALAKSNLFPLKALGLSVIQINLGKMCNQTCKHCHVDAGPDRTEIMSRETMEQCLRVLEPLETPTVDLTGGAPEMNPHFRWLVERLREDDRHVIDRCNLTILTVGAFRDLPEFLAQHRVEIIASLPYYSARSTDSQRGDGVFIASIQALRRLNELGYGVEGSGLSLNLVYNPTGAFLGPKQASVEPEYRRELLQRHGIVFNRLFVLTNMPINRYLEFLQRTGQYEAYMHRLIEAYNPVAAENVMCRTMLSVGWDGALFDCDFNQMLELPIEPGLPRHVSELDANALIGRAVTTGLHCYGCTAGGGSSCGGQVTG